MTRVIDRPVLVLNKHWEPIGTFDVATAITTVIRDMGAVVDPVTFALHDFASWSELRPAYAELIRTAHGGVPAPEIIVLREYAARPERKVSFSRKNLYRRDGYRCQYCGAQPGTDELTIDHVVPRARGGKTTWENCVLACVPCNGRKADRTPEQAGLRLRTTPSVPRWRPTLSVARDHFRPSWESFVSKAYWNVELRD